MKTGFSPYSTYTVSNLLCASTAQVTLEHRCREEAGNKYKSWLPAGYVILHSPPAGLEAEAQDVILHRVGVDKEEHTGSLQRIIPECSVGDTRLLCVATRNTRLPVSNHKDSGENKAGDK